MPEYSTIIEEDFSNVQIIPGFEKLSSLLVQFYNVIGLASFIVDLKGNILHRVGWKTICAEFHSLVLDSDTILADRKKMDERCSICTCQNGMMNIETPINIDGVHVANLFIGQFFFDVPDKDLIGESVQTAVVQEKEKSKKIIELFSANQVPILQNKENETQAAELVLANKELILQNNEKENARQS
jgi:ligand-binding sensor protein